MIYYTYSLFELKVRNFYFLPKLGDALNGVGVGGGRASPLS